MDPPEDSDDLSVVLEGVESAGPPISVSLAEYVTTCATKRIEREHLKSLRQKVKRPENCPQVVAPPVNPVIWRELDKFQRTRDVHLQTAQLHRPTMYQCHMYVVRDCTRTRYILYVHGRVDRQRRRLSDCIKSKILTRLTELIDICSNC